MVKQKLCEIQTAVIKHNKVTENDVKWAIKNFLDQMNIWNFPIIQGLGSYKGIPDRFAVYKGVVYGIEVKSPTGKQSDAQVAFQEKWEYNYHGGTYILARSVEDVIKGMDLDGKFNKVV